ncbi:DUF4038 domain-containing protein [Microbacterium resistens]|uniref:apiosidase-like domain-containing protein n=1 Tax=Microbacterium resistens TaxID=156977 RepID=UPI001C56E0C8|nr:DUF4038 domain-containing protein [Microbacterium resistens]MBW1639737.1 DUF4038 domain-containing protein [Microbacterium resistens]
MSANILQYEVAEIDLGPAADDARAELDVLFTDPAGTTRNVPAFASRGRWKVRYSSALTGLHRWSTDAAHGEIEIRPRTGTTTRRLDHGPLQVSGDGTTFEHADGTPFLWLGDTWWHGFVTEKISDEEFADLASQRNQQGFTLVQIVAGLPCEVQPFDEANRARAGFAWEENFTAINDAWWDDADARIAALVENDLVPCILGSWGYHFRLLTHEQFARHWREMIARWSAYPVVWCISGEPNLPNYDELKDARAGLTRAAQAQREAGGVSVRSEFGLEIVLDVPEIARAVASQIDEHNRIARHVRESDPFQRLVTTHMVPGIPAWTFIDDSVVDFWMLQTGHAGFNSLDPTHRILREALDREPRKPVVNGEVNYEGIADTSYADIQRFLFWSQLLAGAAGFTYGAHGVWAFNTDRFPGQHSGLAPHWKDAAQFSGAAQIGVGRKVLDRYPWATAKPAPRAIDPHAGPANPRGPRAVEFPDGRRLIYVPSFGFQPKPANPIYSDLGQRRWRLDYVDIKSGELVGSDILDPDESGCAQIPGLLTGLPSWGDWLLELTPLSS